MKEIMVGGFIQHVYSGLLDVNLKGIDADHHHFAIILLSLYHYFVITSRWPEAPL